MPEAPLGPPTQTASLFLFFGKHGAKTGFGVVVALARLELPEDGVPANVNFVPLVLDIPQHAFVGFAEVAQGGRAANQFMDLDAARAGHLQVCENHLELLDEHAFNLEELVFVLLPEFLAPGKADE